MMPKTMTKPAAMQTLLKKNNLDNMHKSFSCYVTHMYNCKKNIAFSAMCDIIVSEVLTEYQRKGWWFHDLSALW